MTNFLRLGDTEARGDQAIEIQVKTCKAAMRARPTSMKKFAKREKDLSSADAMDWEEADEEVEALRREEYAPLDRRTEYVVEKSEEEESGKADGMDVDETDKAKEEHAKVDPDDLVKAYKYGATWVPVEEGDFEKLPSKQGIEITAFIHEEKVRLSPSA
jgi:ATP-dependent DNA helicase 2 subunit 2